MVKELVEGLVKRSWFLTALPWIFGGVCLLALGAGLFLASLYLRIAALELDVETQKAVAAVCDATFAKHLGDDEKFLTQQLLAKAEKEAKDRAERARIEKESKETRDALARENDVLREDLRTGAIRVRAELCTPAAPATAPGTDVRGARTAAGSSASGSPPSGADLVAESIGAGFTKDALYDELWKMAVADRQVCGVQG